MSWLLSPCSLPGRRRGWPRPPRLIAGIPSRIGSTNRLSCRFAAETSTFSGRPWASTSRWYLLPALPRSGSARSAHPPFRPNADRVQAGPRPVQLALLTEPVQDGLVHAVEHAGLGPLAHPPPAGPARPVVQLGRQPGPADAGGQHEGDALEHIAVGDPRAAGASMHRRRLRQDQRLDQRPQLAADQPGRRERRRRGHARQAAPNPQGGTELNDLLLQRLVSLATRSIANGGMRDAPPESY